MVRHRAEAVQRIGAEPRLEALQQLLIQTLVPVTEQIGGDNRQRTHIFHPQTDLTHRRSKGQPLEPFPQQIREAFGISHRLAQAEAEIGHPALPVVQFPMQLLSAGLAAHEETVQLQQQTAGGK